VIRSDRSENISNPERVSSVEYLKIIRLLLYQGENSIAMLYGFLLSTSTKLEIMNKDARSLIHGFAGAEGDLVLMVKTAATASHARKDSQQSYVSFFHLASNARFARFLRNWLDDKALRIINVKSVR
jgi:hypothetical protein